MFAFNVGGWLALSIIVGVCSQKRFGTYRLFSPLALSRSRRRPCNSHIKRNARIFFAYRGGVAARSSAEKGFSIAPCAA